MMLKCNRGLMISGNRRLAQNVSLTTSRSYNNNYSRYQTKTKTQPSPIESIPDITENIAFEVADTKNTNYVTKPLKEVINTASLYNITPRKESIDLGAKDIDWNTSFRGLSAEPFSEAACKVLREQLSKLDIEIKPDGIIYLPEIKYRRILNKAFGPGAWGLVPRSEAVIINSNIVTRDYALVILGRLVSLCSGEQTFFGDDQIITSLEGCKSNALMRCCKDLGIASELWDPIFISDFKSRFCKPQIVEHVKTKAKKRIWMKNTDNTAPYPFKICK